MLVFNQLKSNIVTVKGVISNFTTFDHIKNLKALSANENGKPTEESSSLTVSSWMLFIFYHRSRWYRIENKRKIFTYIFMI